jgi:hypothetical protein
MSGWYCQNFFLSFVKRQTYEAPPNLMLKVTGGGALP